ncbi:Xaa-Pro dipeptidase [Marinobacter sp. X15-166B]|uniref:Xaa-Pro dipeptidase n=1 Tax=Marinobacter sp. X15-166B TaxID=1897620 RepID=UPI00085C3BE6|nr:Xaa-Pro dipeptidase [Marinobacter sp. X15-166B]OEY66406.1 Xaa-Pro dipeptidase [Marinobacter sp. X15-166B]
MAEISIERLQVEHVATLQQRYEQAVTQAGYDALLISSGAAPLRYGDDHSYVFQGYGPFVHWTGLPELEHSWLLIRPGHRPVLWVYTPEDFWHATPALPQAPWTDLLDVQGMRSRSVPDLSDCGRVAVLGDPACLVGVAADPNPAALLGGVEAARVHKTPYELHCLEVASARAARGHQAAAHTFLAGGSEFDISLAYQQATAQRAAEAPYHSIIGLNEHAGILHYQYYASERPPEGRSLLIDAGYRYRGYGSDITRTYAAPGQDLFQALIDGLEAIQRRVCAAVAPGVDFVALHDTTHRALATLLRALGLVTGLTEEAIVTRGITRVFFPHGLGHLLGVQVHDVAGKPRKAPDHAPFLRLTRPLETGMVVTIEPGVYFIPSLLEPLLAGALGKHINRPMLDELRPCGGIRIEDNLVVTAAGSDNLTRRYLS